MKKTRDEDVAGLRRNLERETEKCVGLEARLAQLEEELTITKGQLRLVERIAGSAQSITISGEHATVNIVSKGAINRADGHNARVETL